MDRHSRRGHGLDDRRLGLQDVHAHQVHFQRTLARGIACVPCLLSFGGYTEYYVLYASFMCGVLLRIDDGLWQPHPGGVVAMDMSPDAMFLVTLSASRLGTRARLLLVDTGRVCAAGR